MARETENLPVAEEAAPSGDVAERQETGCAVSVVMECGDLSPLLTAGLVTPPLCDVQTPMSCCGPTSRHVQSGDKSPHSIDEQAEPVRIPITGELDLHTFLPREAGRVMDAYIEACLEKGIGSVRIIHGKGTGTLRETVHAFLRRDSRVAGFRLGDETSGGWGATVARLRSAE